MCLGKWHKTGFAGLWSLPPQQPFHKTPPHSPRMIHFGPPMQHAQWRAFSRIFSPMLKYSRRFTSEKWAFDAGDDQKRDAVAAHLCSELSLRSFWYTHPFLPCIFVFFKIMYVFVFVFLIIFVFPLHICISYHICISLAYLYLHFWLNLYLYLLRAFSPVLLINLPYPSLHITYFLGF